MQAEAQQYNSTWDSGIPGPDQIHNLSKKIVNIIPGCGEQHIWIPEQNQADTLCEYDLS